MELKAREQIGRYLLKFIDKHPEKRWNMKLIKRSWYITMNIYKEKFANDKINILMNQNYTFDMFKKDNVDKRLRWHWNFNPNMSIKIYEDNYPGDFFKAYISYIPDISIDYIKNNPKKNKYIFFIRK